jgi:hypothetical protein
VLCSLLLADRGSEEQEEGDKQRREMENQRFWKVDEWRKNKKGAENVICRVPFQAIRHRYFVAAVSQRPGNPHNGGGRRSGQVQDEEPFSTVRSKKRTELPVQY